MEDPERAFRPADFLVEGPGEGFFSRSLFALQKHRPVVVGPLGHLLEYHLEMLVAAGDLARVLGQGRALGEGGDVLDHFHGILDFLAGYRPRGGKWKPGNPGWRRHRQGGVTQWGWPVSKTFLELQKKHFSAKP